jgi:hypothetical protein
VSLLLLLVGVGFLPLGVQIRAFASLSQVELGLFLLHLLSLPFVQGQRLGLFLLGRPIAFLRVIGSVGVLGGFSALGCRFGWVRRDVGLVLLGLNIVLEGAPVVGARAFLLVDGLDSTTAKERVPMLKSDCNCWL